MVRRLLRRAAPMKASIVIATRDRRESLAATLTALEALRAPPGLTWEVIVVDNGSTDGTAEICTGRSSHPFPLRRISEPRRGKSRALNTGVAAARGDFIAFIDDDVRPDAGWLEEIARPLTEGRADAVNGSVRIAPERVRPWMTATHRAWLAETRPDREGVGANLAVRREVLGVVPGFDPELGPGTLGLWEDTLFLAQVRSAGLRVTAAPEALAEHHFHETRLERSGWLKHAAAQGRSEAYVAWHWEHAPDHAALVREVALRFRLLARRVRRRPIGPAPEWELDLLAGIAFERQWRRERNRRRAYSRRGLVKSTGPR